MTTGSGRRGTEVHGFMSSITNPCRQGYVSIRYSNSTHTVTGSLMSTGNMAPDTKENILFLMKITGTASIYLAPGGGPCKINGRSPYLFIFIWNGSESSHIIGMQLPHDILRNTDLQAHRA